MAPQIGTASLGSIPEAPVESHKPLLEDAGITVEAPEHGVRSALEEMHKVDIKPIGSLQIGIRHVKKTKNSTRVPCVWPEIWQVMTPKQKRAETVAYREALELHKESGTNVPHWDKFLALPMPRKGSTNCVMGAFFFP